MNTQAHITEEQFDTDGMIAIQTIEETVADIMRRNGYSATRAAQQMTHFAKGYVRVTVPTQSTTAVQNKIYAMIDDLIKTTCLTPKEIDDLIVMVNFA